MIEAIKDNWWYIAPEPVPPPPLPPDPEPEPEPTPDPEPNLSWRATNTYCVTENGQFTGYRAWTTLEQFNVDTGQATGVTKDNIQGDPNYVAPIQDEAVCPIPNELGWRPIGKYCIKNGSENTGYAGYTTLEQYDTVTMASTGITKPNTNGDPDYVAPTQDTIMCPVNVYAWEGYEPYCITQIVADPPPPEEPPLEIDSNTRINIFFDSSGSMSSTLTALRAMRDNQLQSRLLPYYGTVTKYKENVNVLTFDSERFLLALTDNLNPNGRTINMVFQNEAGRESQFFNIERGYHDSNCSFSAYQSRLDGYNEDMATFNSRLNTYTKPYNGIMFQIEANCDGFRLLIEAMFNGIGNYAGSNGVSTREGMIAKYNIDSYSTATQFTNLLVNTLNELNFNIP